MRAPRSSCAAAAGLLLVLLAVAGRSVHSQGVPPADECRAKFEAVGQNTLISRLAPCQSGPTEACCSAGQSIAGIGGGGELAGCLCNADLLEEVISTALANRLARAAGITRELIIDSLQSCGVEYAGGTGDSACPGAGGAPAAAEQEEEEEEGPSPSPSASPSPSPAPAPSGDKGMAQQAEGKEEEDGGGRRRFLPIGKGALAQAAAQYAGSRLRRRTDGGDDGDSGRRRLQL